MEVSLQRKLDSLVAQMVMGLPLMQETWVQSLGQDGPLEKEMATHSSILAWKIPWMKEHGGLQSMGSPRVRHDLVTNNDDMNILGCYLFLEKLFSPSSLPPLFL